MFSLFTFECDKFADTARDTEKSNDLLKSIQKFTQLARTIIKSCIFLGVGPFPNPKDLDTHTQNLINIVTQRFAQTGYCLCLDSSALHYSRQQVFVNCWWTNTNQYACVVEAQCQQHNGLLVSHD